MPNFDEWCKENGLSFKHSKNREAARQVFMLFDKLVIENEELKKQVETSRTVLSELKLELEQVCTSL